MSYIKETGGLSFLRKFEDPKESEESDYFCIIKIKAGVGGKESENFALMLYDHYISWAMSLNMTVGTLKRKFTSEEGLQEAKLLLYSDKIDVYAKFCNETGVHRLVRVSPFDANKRRHTSFVSVDVIEVNCGGTHANAMDSSSIRSYYEDRHEVVDHLYNKTHKVNMQEFFKSIVSGKI